MYTVGEIRVFPDAVQLGTLKDTLIEGVHFMKGPDGFYVKPEIILRNIFIHQGQIYTRDAYDKTYRQLSQIEAFKFVAVNGQPDTINDSVMNYNIVLTRNKKMGVGGDLELTYSTISFTRRSLVGLSGNINYNNRNLLRGAEVFNTSLETGIEVNLGNRDTLVNSFNLTFQNSVTIPKFIDPIGLYGRLGGIRKAPEWKFRSRFGNQLDESISRISGGYSYVRLINFYDYHAFDLKFGYEIQPDYRRRITISHAGIDFFSPDFKPAFQAILDAR